MKSKKEAKSWFSSLPVWLSVPTDDDIWCCFSNQKSNDSIYHPNKWEDG